MADEPQILGPGGQPVASQVTRGTMQAQFAYQAARASQDAEKSLTKFFDVMRKFGMTQDEAAKHAGELFKAELQLLGIRENERDAMRRFAPELNMTVEQFKKMPLKDVARGLVDMAKSMLQGGNSLATMATAGTAVVTTLKMVIDAFGRMRSAAGAFALGGGDVGRAVTPTAGDLQAINRARLSANVMGFGGRDFQQMSAAMARGARLNPQQGAEAVTGAAAAARLTGEAPETVARRLGQALQSGVSMSQWSRAIFDMTHDMAGFGVSASEAADQTQELWLSSRALGVGFEESKNIVKRFSGELAKGVTTVSDLQNMDPARRQLSQTVAALMVARQQGTRLEAQVGKETFRVTAGDPRAMFNQLLAMPKEAQLAIMQQANVAAISGLGRGVGGAFGRKAVMEGGAFGAQGALGEAMMAPGFSLAKAMAIPKPSIDASGALDSLRSSAEQVNLAHAGSAEAIRMGASAAQVFGDKLVEATSHLDEFSEKMKAFTPRGAAEKLLHMHRND